MFDIYFQDEEWELGRERLRGKIRYLLYELKILKKTSFCYIFYIKYSKHTISTQSLIIIYTQK